MIDPSSIAENIGTIAGLGLAMWLGIKKVLDKIKVSGIEKTGCTACTKEVEMESLAKQVKAMSEKVDHVLEEMAYVRGCMEVFLKMQSPRKDG